MIKITQDTLSASPEKRDYQTCKSNFKFHAASTTTKLLSVKNKKGVMRESVPAERTTGDTEKQNKSQKVLTNLGPGKLQRRTGNYLEPEW